MLKSSSGDRRDIDDRTFICLAAGEETAPLQQLANHVSLEKTRLLEVELLHKEILFSLESAGF